MSVNGSEKPTWDLDEHLADADWTKTAWDLPPYRSKEFFDLIGHDDASLDAFKKLPTYAAAVASGKVIDDEWADDWIETAFPDTEQPDEGEEDEDG